MFAKKTIARLKSEYDRHWEVFGFVVNAKTYIFYAPAPPSLVDAVSKSDALSGLEETISFIHRPMFKIERERFRLEALPWYRKIFIP